MKSKLAAILAAAVLSSASFVFAQDVVHDVDKGGKRQAMPRIRRQKTPVTPPR